MNYFQHRKVHFLCFVIIGLSLLLLTSCAKRTPDSDIQMQVHVTSKDQSQPEAATLKDINLSGKSPITPPEQADYKILEPITEPPHPETKSGKTQYQFDDTSSITVAVENLPLPDFINRIFGDLLQVNYVLSDKVTGREKLSLSLDKKVSPRMLFDTVTEILNRFKISVVEKKGVFYIAPETGRTAPTLGWGEKPADIPVSPGQVRQIVPLRYIDAQTMMNILGNVPGVKTSIVMGQNTLSVIGSRDGVGNVLEYVSAFDQPAMRGRFAAMQRIKYWTPSDLILKLKEILISEGIPWSDTQGRGGVKLINIDRWRLILVFAAEEKWLERVHYWINTLDVPEEAKEGRYFIYFPENSRASDLMTTLQTILGSVSDQNEPPKIQGSETPDAVSQPVAAASTGIQSAVRSVSPFSRTARSNIATTKQGVPTSQSGIGAATGPGLPGLAVDEVRNALILYTDADHYKSIETLLKQLDIMPPQVYIEATVAEVTLTDNLQYGLEWYLKNIDGSQTSILSTKGGLGIGSAGLNFSMVTDSQKYQLLINALAEKELVQVLSSPSITVRDGKSASIVVGTQVPVVTSEVASSNSVTTENTTGVVRSYQYLTTGISLNVTPTVHARGVVTLEIDQDVSEASASGGENPLILNRTLNTEVVAASGQTLVIGGLIKQNNGITNSSVPFFGSLPLLRYLFTNTKDGKNRTELVVMITPYIIRSTLEIEDIQQKIFKNFEHLNLDVSGNKDKKDVKGSASGN